MSGTVFDWYFATVRTDQFLRIEWACILCFVHGRHTVFSPSEVWLFAFETHKVRVYYAGILFWFSKVRRILVFEFFVIFLQFLKLQSIGSHCLNLLLESFKLFGWLVKLAIWTDWNPLFAEWAIAEVEENTRSKPFDVISFLQTFYVEDVSTTAHNAWRSWERLYVADSAVLIAINALQSLLVGSCTFLVEARQTFALSSIAKAGVSAWIYLTASHPSWCLALCCTADIGESLFVALEKVLLSERFIAIAAFSKCLYIYFKRARSLYSLHVIPKWYGAAWQDRHCSALHAALGHTNRLTA